MKKRSAYLLILAVFCTFLFSCKKGDTGPAGDTGPQGPTGNAGPQGPPGNANVKTDTFTLTNADWKYPGSYFQTTTPGVSLGYTTRFSNRSFAGLTADILNKGAVLVYFTANAGNAQQWTPLNQFIILNGVSYNYVYETSVGQVKLHFWMTKATSDPPTLSSFTLPPYKFKIVLVGGEIANTAPASAGKQSPGPVSESPAPGEAPAVREKSALQQELEGLPYAEVCKKLGISP
ncbi:MAG: collagen-like protein [Chitinophagaceae bacterium]|nr:collagen-like protein [Chitinophagaceae bacterium]